MGSVNMNFVQFFNPHPAMPKPSHRPASIPLFTPSSLPARPSSPVTPFQSSRTTQSPSCQLPLSSCFQSTTPIHNIPGLPQKPTQQPKTVLQGASRNIEPQDLSAEGPEKYRHESSPVATAPASSVPVESSPFTDAMKHCDDSPWGSLQEPIYRPKPQPAGNARGSHCNRVPEGAPSFELLQNENENKNSKSVMGDLEFKLVLTKRQVAQPL